MKRRNRLLIAGLLLVLSLALGQGVSAQVGQPSVVTVETSVVVEDNGDSRLSTSIEMTAQQFAGWKEKYGLNPSLLRRDMGKTMSQFETLDFKVDQNDMDREVTVSFLVKGMVVHKGGGRYEMTVPENWEGGRRVGNEYEFHYPESIDPNTIAQNSVRVTLPDDASGFREQLAEQGDKVIEYRMPRQSSGKIQLMAGALLGVVGVVLVGLSYLGGKRKPAA